MKWIGQHIYDLVARFRNDVYLEDLSTTTETNVLVVDSDGKVSKTTVITGDVTGVTAGDNITVTDPTGPVPTVALSTNVDVAGTLDVTDLGTFDASITVAGKISLNDGGNSVFVGEGAGLNDDASANLNVGVGYQALHANTTGSANTANGFTALYSNTTGDTNTAFGAAALYYNTTGYQNIAVGSNAGAFITDGINLNTVTSNSVFLGSNTKALADSQTNQIVIGYDATGLGSNTAILGNSSITKTQLQGDVGIGTASPENLLHIKAADGVTGVLKIEGGKSTVTSADEINSQLDFGSIDGSVNNTGNVGGRISSITESTNGALVGMAFSTFQQSRAIDLQEAMRITNAGNVGIGITDPANKLTVSGDIGYTGVIGQGNIYGNPGNTSFATMQLYNSQNGFSIFNNQSYGYNFNTGGTTRVAISNAGDVGIGTDTPSGNLHISSGTSEDCLLIIEADTDNNDENDTPQIWFKADGGINEGLIGLNDNTLDLINNVSASGGIRFLTGSTSNTGTTTPYTSATERMRITSAGNVGIGKASPQNKLDIVGSLGRGAPVIKTATFTVGTTENWLIMNGEATITITLPTASDWTGRELMIKNINDYPVVSASSNVKPIHADTAGSTIFGGIPGSWCMLVSDGTNWVTMMSS